MTDTHIPVVIPVASHIISVDVGRFTARNTGWGLVIQDQLFCTSFASCRKEEIVTEPLVGEALGLCWAILTAKERNVLRPCVRTDVVVLVDRLHQKTSRSSIDLIIQICRQLLLDFESPIVTHIKRIDNDVAHQLVGLAQALRNHVWFGYEQLSSLASICNVSIFI